MKNIINNKHLFICSTEGINVLPTSVYLRFYTDCLAIPQIRRIR